MLQHHFSTCLFAFFITSLSCQGVDLFVDPVRGLDSHSGTTPEQSFKTVEAARNHIRSKHLNQNQSEDLVVYLRGGRYPIEHTLVFSSKDSGSQGKKVIYRNYKGETPIFCGGIAITGWKKVSGKPYYEADASKALQRAGFFRQLYVDGIRAQRARSHTFLTNTRKKWWDDPATPEPYDGFYVKKREFSQSKDLEVFYSKGFKVGYLHVDSILPSDQEDELIVKMEQPDYGVWMTWNNIKRNPKFEYMFVNSFEDLDEPGEWYVNRNTKKIYYYPAISEENLTKIETYVPATEFLLSIVGKEGEKVKDLTFQGITFRYGNWLAPEKRMLGRTQAEIFDMYQSEIPGQIRLDYTDRVTIRDCRIKHMASVGIQLYEDCDNTLIEGNVMCDLTAAGVSVGRWWLQKKNCHPETICRNTMVSNNIVRNTGRDYDQATGLNVFTAYDCKFYHNDVSDTSYTGIHGRIGDSSFVRRDIGAIQFKFNKVSHSMNGARLGIDDGGQLYLHGRYPGSVVEGNYSLYYSSKGTGWEYYSDNWSFETLWLNNVSRYSGHSKTVCWSWHHGSKDVVFKNMWAEKSNLVGKKTAGRAKLINYVQVKKGDQWPQKAVDIMRNAGLEPAYKHLERTIYGHQSLTKNCKVKASSSLNAKSGPSAAIDGDWKTFWHTKLGGDGQGWIAFDLGARYNIQRLEILPRQSMFQEHARSNFEIQASNDKSFKSYKVLAEVNDVTWYHGVQKHPSNLWERYISPHEAFRYLRVQSTSPQGSFNLSEFNAYGYQPAKTAKH